MNRLSTGFFLLAVTAVSAQVPDAVNYQAIARNASGVIMASEPVNVSFKIYDAQAGGTLQYEESHAALMTNQFGLFTTRIGAGTPVTGTFASIDWAGNPNWIEVVVNGATVGSRSQLVAVPYALLARDVENDNVDDADNDPTNELQTISKIGNTVTLSQGGGSFTDDNTTYSAGAGISISGANVISNTGDTDGSDDITTSTTAGGDLSGTYPNPTVDGLQTRPVSAALPALDDVLKWNGGAWAPAADAVGGGGITLPYSNSVNSGSNAFAITNTSTGGGLYGANTSTSSSVSGVIGEITSTTPGGFSAGVRGINKGTGGNGIGVFGSQDGSGWGVYGVAPDGIGVYGYSTAGTGGFFSSASGSALVTEFGNVGIGAASPTHKLEVVQSGASRGIDVTHNGTGTAVFATGGGMGLWGITSGASYAGVLGDNNGGGEAVVGRTTSAVAGAVVGRNDGANAGVRGFTTASGGMGVLGQGGSGGSNSSAAVFQSVNAANTAPIVRITGNSSITAPQLLLHEEAADYARINFTNTSGGTYWAIAGGTNASTADARLNVFHSATGDILSITGDGRVGINAANPSSSLYLSYPSGVGNSFKLNNQTDGDEWEMYMWSSNDIHFYFNGADRASIDDVTGNYTALSDASLKLNIRPAEEVLQRVSQLQVQEYSFLHDPDRRNQIGVLAQDAYELFPELVKPSSGNATEGQDAWMVNYAGFSMVAIKAIQELNDQIEQLKARITELENR